MKKKFQIWMVAALSLLTVSNAMAQDYKVGVGLNLGASVGATVKYNFTQKSSMEGILAYNFRCNAPMLTALYEYNVPLAPSFGMYAGGGINIGAIHTGNHHVSEFALGLSPIVGFEYNFNGAPISLGVDYKPAINLTCHSIWNEAGLKLRYKF